MPAPNPEALGFDSQRLAKLDAYMGKAVADGRVAGMSTLLARQRQVKSQKISGIKSLASGAPHALHLPPLFHVGDHRRRDDDAVRGRGWQLDDPIEVRAGVQDAGEGDERGRENSRRSIGTCSAHAS
jgi:hypothetical protein